MNVSHVFLRSDARIDGLQWRNTGSVQFPRRATDASPAVFRRTKFVCKGGTGSFTKEVWESVSFDDEVIVVFYHGVDTDYALRPHGNYFYNII